MGVTFVALSAAVSAAVAIGIETARLASNKTFMQDLGDSAALYGATLVRDSALGDEAVASNVRQWMVAQLTGSDFRLDEAGIVVTVDRARGAVRIEASAEQDLLLPFLNSSGPVAVTTITEAAAVETTPDPGLCGLALDAAEKKAMHFKGDGEIDAPKCVFWSNSRDKDATHGLGDGGAETRKVCSVGRYSKLGAFAIAPPPEDYCAALADPYAVWTPPTPTWTSCDHGSSLSPAKFDGAGGDVVLSPGVYCGGLDVGNARDVTFKPGRYFIDGKTTVDAARRIEGQGVYFQVRGADANVDFKADTINLGHAPDKALANVLFYKEADPANPAIARFDAATDFRGEGVFYAPNDELQFKIARKGGAPAFGFGAIADLVTIDMVKGDVFAFKPLIGIRDGVAVIGENKEARLLR